MTLVALLEVLLGPLLLLALTLVWLRGMRRDMGRRNEISQLNEAMRELLALLSYVARANLRGEVVDDDVLERLAKNAPEGLTIFDFVEEFDDLVKQVENLRKTG